MPVAIHTQPDKTYNIQRVYQRFELDESMRRSPVFKDLLEAAAKEVVRLAAEKNALRGWHWRSDLGVEVDESELQYDLYASSGSDLPVQDSGSILLKQQGRIAYVVKMWYLVPQIASVVYEPEELAEPDGFVEQLPEDHQIETDL